MDDVLAKNIAVSTGRDFLPFHRPDISEAEISQLVRRINVLQSNLGIWQRE